MGVTIYYNGKLSNVGLVYELIREITDIASIMKWSCNKWDDDWSIKPSATIVNKEKKCEIKGHLGLKGVSFTPHPDCEAVNLTFDRYGTLQDPRVLPLILDGTIKDKDSTVSVKTQFAGADTHIVIIKLLQHVKRKYIPDLYVFDEGEYWQNENRQILEERINSINHAMDVLEDALSKAPIPNSSSMTGEEIYSLIEQILKDKFGFCGE